MGTTITLSACTLKHFVASLENKTFLRGDCSDIKVTVAFYPRYYFLTYSTSPKEQKTAYIIQQYYRGEENFSLPHLRLARELTVANAIENACDLPLRKNGFTLQEKRYIPSPIEGVLARVEWTVVKLPSPSSQQLSPELS